jgi:protein-arginine kinase activator protein McsA
MFERICPQCKKKLYYSNIKNRNKAEKEKILCKDCVFVNKKYETLIKKHKYNKKRLTEKQIEYIKTIWDNQNAVWQYVKLNIERKKEIALQNKETTAWDSAEL